MQLHVSMMNGNHVTNLNVVYFKITFFKLGNSFAKTTPTQTINCTPSSLKILARDDKVKPRQQLR